MRAMHRRKRGWHDPAAQPVERGELDMAELQSFDRFARRGRAFQITEDDRHMLRQDLAGEGQPETRWQPLEQ